ncbi:hypothetical protein GCM10023191_037000 [Actinoallomurus oryzae]|uniref:Uncharacterized protein n=1 Tax=Actinoallomurus oryzae TaxID=502180 RepID=A0ABP8PZV4_9ACTN
MANPNRTKYNRRRAGAILGTMDEATVVTAVLSTNQRTLRPASSIRCANRGSAT